MAFDRTLVAVRERSMIDLLDLALVIIRERPRTIGLTALLGICPFLALNAWLFRWQDTQNSDATGLAALLIAFELPLATAPLTMILGRIMFLDTPRPGAVVRALLGSLPQMLIYQYVIRGICFFPIFWLLLPVKLAFLPEVVLLERGKWYRVLKRSSNLCNGRGGELFFCWILSGAYIVGFAFLFWAGTSQILGLLFEIGSLREEFEDGVFFNPRFQLGLWLAFAFFTVFRFLLYIDQRIRLEGWEVELRLRSVGAALAEGRRW